jgi:putative radical SAM enzyme (TIGR03279 family)
MRLSPLYVSVHATDLELRRQFLRNDQAPDILEQLNWLAKRGIVMHTQVVIVPGLNDGQWLKRSIDELSVLWPAVQSVSVVPVGLTKNHKYGMRPHTASESREMLSYLEDQQSLFAERFGERFVYPTDEWYLVAGREVPPLQAYDGHQLQENGLGLVRLFLDEWAQLIEEMDRNSELPRKYNRLSLVTGTLFSGTLEPVAKEFGARAKCQVDVVPITNARLGETITAAGLLMAGDVIDQKQRLSSAELLVLPRVMFDHPDRISLDNYSPQDIANEMRLPIALADVMGDVWDACTGHSQVIFEPQDASGLE